MYFHELDISFIIFKIKIRFKHFCSISTWNIFDTSTAYQTIKYQKDGHPLHGTTMGLNKLCQEYGLPANPLKQMYRKRMGRGGHYSKYDSTFYQQDTIPEEHIVYSASDVEPLIDLHNILAPHLSPGLPTKSILFSKLFTINDLCEKVCFF